MRVFLLSILMIGVIQVFSQEINLVANPSFEEFYYLPDNFTQVKEKNQELIPKWFFLATPDYFNKNCRSKIVDVPSNFAGSMQPKQGLAYVGLILRADPVHYTFSPKYNEHLENEMEKPMIKDQLYCVQMYISMAKKSGFAVDAFGVYFSKRPIIFEDKGSVTKYKPQVENKTGNIMFVKNEWMIFRGIYKAKGGEHYFTMGNFKTIEETGMLRLKSKLKEKIDYFSYYYIDQVSVRPIKKIDECACTAESHTLDSSFVNNIDLNDTLVEEGQIIAETSSFGKVEFGKPVVLKNIYFDFDKFDLLPKSFTELDHLFTLIKDLQECEITIMGHTDSLGTEMYNKTLSENRARSVVFYLTSKGFDKERIKFEGYGSVRPVATNNTDEGRQENRRVEFIINQKKKNVVQQ